LTPKSDIFSAGVVFHVLLTGRYLFQGKSPKSVFDKNKEFKFDLTRPEYGNLDPSALELLQRMLEIDGEKRFSASECLSHQFLREDGEGEKVEKVEISPASTSEDYHF
jgi:serine/threonine protein kinase